MFARKVFITAIIALCLCGWAAVGLAQSSGSLQGKVTIAERGNLPAHNVAVLIVQLRRSVHTNEDGTYRFEQVPPGSYDVVASLDGFADIVQHVEITGDTTTTDFELRISPIREQVNVTATGREELATNSLQSVRTIDSTTITERARTSLGEVLENEPGVSKRSFGPGSARPVIRGFDGDRVLVLQDGIAIGSLGSQSGDHGEPLDTLSLDRIEIVRGPATLLYGSNAIGGVVSAVSDRFNVPDRPKEGLTGFMTVLGGSANRQSGIAAGFNYGIGRFLLWGSGAQQRAGDYETPLGRVPNSKSRYANGAFGFGYYGAKGFFNFGYNYDERRYGIPFAAEFEAEEKKGGGKRLFGEGPVDPVEEAAETIDLDMRRHNFKFSGGVRNLDSFITGFRMILDYTDYEHKELEGTEVGTFFDNRLLSYRGVFDQQKRGRFSGSFGFQGMVRDYATVGAEALAPPVEQRAFAVFGLEQIDFERVVLQFGGRVENTRYEAVGFPRNTYTGFSGAVGARIPLGNGFNFVANYTHSYRAPALEELYNNGPHIGNLIFEVGNSNLRRERSDGLDLSLRYSRSDRLRAEANFFYYRLKDFVFLAPTGEIEDGLPVGFYSQADTRFVGGEAGLEVGLIRRHLFLNLGFDVVDAQLSDSFTFDVEGVPVVIPSGTGLPRIPPVRGRVGLDLRYGGLSVRPEAFMASSQDDIFPTETRTGGYTVFNLLGSYTIPQEHLLHIFSVNAFNLGDRLYRNHVSFIKDLAPEIGRGVRVSYTLRFF